MSEIQGSTEIDPEDDLVEIDWDAIQAAVNGFADAGIEMDDNGALGDHLSALLAALLRKQQQDESLEDEELAEVAAEIAAFAIDLAIGPEELPEFVAEEDVLEN